MLTSSDEPHDRIVEHRLEPGLHFARVRDRLDEVPRLGMRAHGQVLRGPIDSANTRRNGSAKAAAVYSIRGVCPIRPQPQVSVTRVRRLAPGATASAITRSRPARSAPSRSGDTAPRRLRRREPQAGCQPPWCDRVQGRRPTPTTRYRAGHHRRRAERRGRRTPPPAATWQRASTTAPRRAVRGAIRARHRQKADAERLDEAGGREPARQREHADRRPACRSRLPGRGICAPASSAWNTSHSDANPFSGGSAAIAAEPNAERAAPSAASA